MPSGFAQPPQDVDQNYVSPFVSYLFILYSRKTNWPILSLYIYTHIHMYRYLTCEIIPKILPENALGSIGNFWSIINYISLINDYIWTIIKYIDAISIGPPPTRLYICQFHLQFVNWWIWSLIYNISTNYTYIYISTT